MRISFFLHIVWHSFQVVMCSSLHKNVDSHVDSTLWRSYAKLLYHLKVFHFRILQHHLLDEIKVCVCMVFARVSSSIFQFLVRLHLSFDPQFELVMYHLHHLELCIWRYHFLSFIAPPSATPPRQTLMGRRIPGHSDFPIFMMDCSFIVSTMQ